MQISTIFLFIDKLLEIWWQFYIFTEVIRKFKKSLNMIMKQKFEAIWWITNVKLQTQNIRRFYFWFILLTKNTGEKCFFSFTFIFIKQYTWQVPKVKYSWYNIYCILGRRWRYPKMVVRFGWTNHLWPFVKLHLTFFFTASKIIWISHVRGLICKLSM